MGGFLSRGERSEQDEGPAEGPGALGAADDNTDGEEKGLTNVEEEGKGLTNDGRTYAEVVREGPEKSDWKFVPAAPADVVELP